MSDVFFRFYSIGHINSVYEEKIRFRSGGGIDRITGRKFEAKREYFLNNIHTKSLSGTYKFSPYLEKLISKGRNKHPRMISVPTIRDKLFLSVLNTYLQQEFPNCLKKELPNQRVRKIKQFYELPECNDVFIVRIDIAKFYDSIDQNILLENLESLPKQAIDIIKQAITNPTVPFNSPKKERKRYSPTIGIPQGLPISNILAEIYLSSIDDELSKECMVFDRYVDDIIAITNNPDNFLKVAESKFSNLKLKSNPDKTGEKSIKDTSTYLGYTFSADKVSVRIQSYEKLLSGINKMFSDFTRDINNDVRNQKRNRENIITNFFEDINIKIAGARFDKKRYGWVYYYSEITDIELLHRIDSFVAKRSKQLELNNLPKVKSIVRAYYHIKSKTDSTYTHDYSLFSDAQMLKVLARRGLIQPEENLTPNEIAFRYNKYVLNKISKLEEDLGKDY